MTNTEPNRMSERRRAVIIASFGSHAPTLVERGESIAADNDLDPTGTVQRCTQAKCGALRLGVMTRSANLAVNSWLLIHGTDDNICDGSVDIRRHIWVTKPSN